MLIASSQPAEREAPGEPRVPWPRAPGPPCSGILLAGFQPWRAPLRLRCAAGLVPAPARRLRECLGRECLGRECLHRVIPGHGQRSAAPRGTEGDPCSATFVGGFQTRAKGTGFLLLCKWENILQRKPSLLSQAHQLCSFRRCLL